MNDKTDRKVGLIYPPGKMYQRGEDRSQGNIDDSSATSMRACNDLGYAAAMLRKYGYSIFLRDYQTEKCSMRDLARDFKREQIDYLCLSTTNATVFKDIKLVNVIKKHYPDVKIILKGAIFYDPDMHMLDMLDLSNIDALIGGEIEFCICGIVDAFEGKGDLSSVNNIIYKDMHNVWKKTKFHIWNEDLDNEPFPARDLMKNELYVRPDTGEAMATIQTARGCPSGCIYCLSPDISGKQVRKRSPQNVFEELNECYKKYHIRNFFFKADTFTIDSEWVNELCGLIIDSDLYKKIRFTANSRVNPLKKETLAIMKKAGCFTVAFGFESGSENTLKKIHKGVTVEQNRIAMKWAREVGIPVYGFYMIGFPWESKEDIEKTRRFIFEQNADFIEVHIALPYYGTKLYDECKFAGVLEKNVLGSDYFHSNTRGTASVSMDELNDIRKDIMLKYYLRPGYIIRKFVYGLSKELPQNNLPILLVFFSDSTIQKSLT